MWRDRWLALGIIGTVVSCLACLTPIAVLTLAAVGLGAWTSSLDVVLVPLIVAFAGLASYRLWTVWRAKA
jgi:mercuric ion transport protein